MLTLSVITVDEIARNAKYSLTRYSSADADKVIAVAQKLEAADVATHELESVVTAWLDKNAPDWNSLYVKYEVQSAVELGEFMNSHSACGNVSMKTGGSELYPLSVWNKWIKEHSKYQAELKARWECAKIDMISQAQNVNWWVL